MDLCIVFVMLRLMFELNTRITLQKQKGLCVTVFSCVYFSLLTGHWSWIP